MIVCVSQITIFRFCEKACTVPFGWKGVFHTQLPLAFEIPRGCS